MKIRSPLGACSFGTPTHASCGRTLLCEGAAGRSARRPQPVGCIPCNARPCEPGAPRPTGSYHGARRHGHLPWRELLKYHLSKNCLSQMATDCNNYYIMTMVAKRDDNNT